ncbi:cation:proton antiporter [Lentzea sp.]|uniref:cation:proton antiporter n=1 Tax=Lentzea sp. TaxID=56099 RepID=UPI002BD335AD|nr:cation:proton antiporter [Lentzea sp.]HUQ57184.1 cation:proton antiporter [Lentzea sp.]
MTPVPPFGGHSLFLFLVQVAVLLVLALLMGRLAMRAGMPAIVGELLTGILLGPSLLGWVAPGWAEWLFPHQVEQFHVLDAFGQIGVLLLVGVTGVSLDLALVRKRRGTAVRISLPGLVIPLGLGIGAGFLVPQALLAGGGDERLVFALFLGVAMCVSAIPVIAKTLIDLKLLHRNVGQLILISGTVDDVIGWLGLSVVTAMATTGVHAGTIARSTGFLVLFLVASYVIGRPLVRFVMNRVGDGATIGAAVVVVLAMSALSHLLGLEAVLGALIGGMLIRNAGGDVLEKLLPLRTVVMTFLAPVFFAMAGLRMDLTALVQPSVLVAAVVLLLIAVAGKFAGAFLGAWLSGLNRWEALGIGAGMNARGVVEVVVAMVGLRLGVLSTEMYTIVVLIAIVTSLMSPPILRAAASRIEVTASERLRLREYEPPSRQPQAADPV